METKMRHLETSCFNVVATVVATASCDDKLFQQSCNDKLQRQVATTSFNKFATSLRPSWEIKLGNKLRVKSSKLREDALVGEAAAEALEHRARRKVLARDELDALKLPPPLGLDKPGDRGVNTRERIGQGRSRHF
jgi:hypothetical protein